MRVCVHTKMTGYRLRDKYHFFFWGDAYTSRKRKKKRGKNLEIEGNDSGFCRLHPVLRKKPNLRPLANVPGFLTTQRKIIN